MEREYEMSKKDIIDFVLEFIGVSICIGMMLLLGLLLMISSDYNWA